MPSSKGASKGPSTNHFPSKLHELLDDAEEKGHDGVVSWCPDGKSFRIHHPLEMVPVLTSYFRQTKYKSLLRQLQGYDFKRVTSGDNKGNVSHPMFMRGRRKLCMTMKRKQAKSSTNDSKNDVTSSTNNKNGTVATSTKNPKPTTTGPVNVSSSVGIANLSFPVAPSRCENSASQQKNQSPQFVTPQSPLELLQSNFHSSLNNALLQAPIQHQVTTSFTVPPRLPDNTAGNHLHQQRATGMDALRVEIGCTFSSSKNKNSRMPSANSSSSFKRNAPQQPQPFMAQSSSSAPTFDSVRYSKRQRSDGGFHQLRQPSNSNEQSSSFKNASFPFPMTCGSQQVQTDAILTEERLHFQKSQQEKLKQKEFDRLEKLCFPETQQFHHSHHSTSAIGTMDLDISLTTTTTTTHHNGGNPEVSSSTICNKFVLPSQLEPTPLFSPKIVERSKGFTLNCDIAFPSKVESKEMFFNLPSKPIPQDKKIEECKSTKSFDLSETSDEIDEGIAEAFNADGSDGSWTSTTFESDREDNDDREDLQEDWTKGIIYEGKTDCVLEPEKFQIEVQGMLSRRQQEQLSKPTQYARQQPAQQGHYLQLQQQQAMLHEQGMTNYISQHAPVPQRRMIAHNQPQHVPMRSPYMLLARPIPFNRHLLHGQTQPLKR